MIEAPEVPVIEVPAKSVIDPAEVLEPVARAPFTVILPAPAGDWIVNGALAVHAPTLMAPVPVGEPMVIEAKPGWIVAREAAVRFKVPL